ncbi:zinc-binding dehydrogenase [Bifidobacterium criceti]|uniref:Molecular chaperone GroES n=1 Tax=Bifidobacterium criceti TaxID=1960969 RepID=A0A2A2EGY1_9BIFI|nr:zinc-binding dehydrogenase [Bifidobacterium criceti]PAU68261.1 molecular chaperone GroES [Bifidobacterium criceti]
MRAVYVQDINPDRPLDALAVGELPQTPLPYGWTRIRTRAVSINHHDIWSLKGVGLSADMTPMILGTDVCGVLEEEPQGHTGLKAGDEVVAYTVVGADGAGVLAGERRTILSEKYPGTMADETQVPAANLFAKPANCTIEEAAALGTSWLTAYSMLFSCDHGAQVQPGDSVLIQGAGGGVSSAAIQLAHAAGLEVFVTSRSAEKLDVARRIGADVAVRVGERLPHKVDAVLDSVGSVTWSHSIRSVRPGGTVVTCGATSGDQPGAELTRVFFQDIRIQGNTMGSRDDFARMLRFVEHANLHPVIDATYPAEYAKDAFARVMSGNLFGKVVLTF